MNEDVFLTFLSEQDLPDLFQIQKNYHSANMRQSKGIATSLIDVKEWLRCKMIIQSPKNFVMGVRTVTTREIVGYVTLTSIERDSFSAEIGIVMNEVTGRGKASQALEKLERLAFDSFGYKTLIANILTINIRALSFFDKHSYNKVLVDESHVILEKNL